MKKEFTLLLLSLLIMSSVIASEYRMYTNDTISIADKSVRIETIGMNGVIVDIMGTKSTISIDKPEGFGSLFIIPKEIFYVKEKNERYIIIDFCEKTDEICNNLDDDCDGKIDDNIERECGTNIGICGKGKQKCVNGEWGYCEGDTTPQQEICNGLDDDCDGTVDEDISKRLCGNSPIIGSCTKGTQECINGSWEECQGQVFPEPEKCNSEDDDCDGSVDEDLVKICGVSTVGACTTSTALCKKGEWEDCTAVMPQEETCNGLDDDCDGSVDEDLVKSCGNSDIGECSYGNQECKDAKWSDCEGEILPGTEFCDDLDNDCNGLVDDDCKKKGFFSRIAGWFKGLFS